MLFSFFRPEESKEQCAAVVITSDADEEVLSLGSCSNTEDTQPGGTSRNPEFVRGFQETLTEIHLISFGLSDDILLEEAGSAGETNIETLEESRASEVSGDYIS